MKHTWNDLIEKAKRDDQDAFYELYQSSYDAVYRAVKSMIRDEDTVLDIVQDAFVKGFASLSSLENPDNFLPWMKRIATNKARDWFKKKQEISFSQLSEDEDSEPDFEDERLEHSPEAVIDAQETARLIDEILSTLSDEQRLVIGMFYYQNMSVMEIAQELDVNENTVKSRLNYGRKKIKAGVEELERKGTKLYSLAPIPFLLWLFRGQIAQAATSGAPAAMFGNIMAQSTAQAAATGAAASTAATTATSGTAAAGSTGGGLLSTLGAKITAGVLAAAILGGAVGTAVYLTTHGDDSETPVIADTPMPDEQDPPEIQEPDETPVEPTESEEPDGALFEDASISGFEEFGDIFYINHYRGGTYLTIAEDGSYKIYGRYADSAEEAAEYRETGVFADLKQTADGSYEAEVSSVESSDINGWIFVRGYHDTVFANGSTVHFYPAGTSAEVLGDGVWIASDKVSLYEEMYDETKYIDENGNFVFAVIWMEDSDAAFVASSNSESLREYLNSDYGAFTSLDE